MSRMSMRRRRMGMGMMVFTSASAETAATPASTPHPSTFAGMNFADNILMTRQYPPDYPNSQPPFIPFPNQPVDVESRLRDIVTISNVIRVSLCWEAYEWYRSTGNLKTYLNRIVEVAKAAEDLGLSVVYSLMTQTAISSVIYTDTSKKWMGVGFPAAALDPLGLNKPDSRYVYDVPLVSTDIMTSPKNRFWHYFVTNYTCTIGGVTKPIWEHMWDYYSNVVRLTLPYRSTLGYSLLTSPLSAVDNITTSVYRGLGTFYAEMTKRIRGLASRILTTLIAKIKGAPLERYIFFSELESIRHNDTEIDAAYPDLAGKSAYYKRAELTGRLLLPVDSGRNPIPNVVFELIRFGHLGTFPSSHITQFNEYDRVLSSRFNVPIVLARWNEGSAMEPTTDVYKTELGILKQRRYGWFFFNYDPNHPWSIKDSKYKDRWNSAKTLTFRQMLMDAMKAV
ncbi:MAG: hypothetical protein QW052_07290 [Candidatus Nitrosocaldaceae archaeon]